MKGFSVLLLVLIVVVSAVHEIPMRHRRRTPHEAQLLLEYLNRGSYAQKINPLIAKIFPSKIQPNIYAYPEVKILNYLDSQYYG